MEGVATPRPEREAVVTEETEAGTGCGLASQMPARGTQVKKRCRQVGRGRFCGQARELSVAPEDERPRARPHLEMHAQGFLQWVG